MRLCRRPALDCKRRGEFGKGGEVVLDLWSDEIRAKVDGGGSGCGRCW